VSTHARNVPMPDRVARLPRARGYPAPWFVAWVEGKPEFRVVREGGVVEAARADRCWICGQRLGRYRAYAIGPMCAVNRTSSEPPSHRTARSTPRRPTLRQQAPRSCVS
jgi:hypothetical protein